MLTVDIEQIDKARWYNTSEVSRLLNLKPETLKRWRRDRVIRRRGIGPQAYSRRGRVLYLGADLLTWIRQCRDARERREAEYRRRDQEAVEGLRQRYRQRLLCEVKTTG